MVLIPLSNEVVALIDENRDDLSRYKFIELCMNEYFESFTDEKEEEAEEMTIAGKRAENDRVLVPLSKETVVLIDQNRDDLSRWEFIGLCMNRYLERKEEKKADSAIAEKKTNKPLQVPWKSRFNIMWLGAFFSYGIGDVLSSYLAGRGRAVEGNPVLDYLFGDNVYAIILFKVAVLLSLFLISYYYLENKFTALFIPSVLIFIGIVISLKNFSFISGIF